MWSPLANSAPTSAPADMAESERFQKALLTALKAEAPSLRALWADTSMSFGIGYLDDKQQYCVDVIIHSSSHLADGDVKRELPDTLSLHLVETDDTVTLPVRKTETGFPQPF